MMHRIALCLTLSLTGCAQQLAVTADPQDTSIAKSAAVRVAVPQIPAQTFAAVTPVPRQQLDPQLYWRIHRGCIVRVKSILKVVRDEFGHMTLLLKNNPTELAVSRAYQHLFRQH